MHHGPVLLVIAHGSRDPRHAATVHALVRCVRSQRPGARVETGFLDFNAPSVPQVLDRLAADGARDVVALPLLLSRAFHAKSDIPTVLRAAPARLHVRQADVLGPSTLLLGALETRLYESGLTPADKATTGVVLAAAGSSDPAAVAGVDGVARDLHRRGWAAVRPAYASATLPRTADTLRALRADGLPRVAVAPYVIAPGRLPDRIAAGAVEARADHLAAVLGPSPSLASLLLLRHDEAVASATTALSA